MKKPTRVFAEFGENGELVTVGGGHSPMITLNPANSVLEWTPAVLLAVDDATMAAAVERACIAELPIHRDASRQQWWDSLPESAKVARRRRAHRMLVSALQIVQPTRKELAMRKAGQ
jgi:hypothetical protein